MRTSCQHRELCSDQMGGHLGGEQTPTRMTESLHCSPATITIPLIRSQFSSAAQSCPTLCDPLDSSAPGFSVHHQLPELAQTHVHWGDDAIQPSYPLSSPSPPALNLSQHQGLFQWVSSAPVQNKMQNKKIFKKRKKCKIYQFTFHIDYNL